MFEACWTGKAACGPWEREDCGANLKQLDCILPKAFHQINSLRRNNCFSTSKQNKKSKTEMEEMFLRSDRRDHPRFKTGRSVRRSKHSSKEAVCLPTLTRDLAKLWLLCRWAKSILTTPQMVQEASKWRAEWWTTVQRDGRYKSKGFIS